MMPALRLIVSPGAGPAPGNKTKDEDVLKKTKAEDRAAKKMALDALKEEMKTKRKKARTELCNELRDARKKLKELKWEIVRAEETAAIAVEAAAKIKRRDVAARLLKARDRLKRFDDTYEKMALVWRRSLTDEVGAFTQQSAYPCVPAPMVCPTADGLGIPSSPGIYFLWDEDRVVYVGKSIRLNSRLRLGVHHVLRDDHKISFLFFDEWTLSFAECFYIGILRPHENFGRYADHKRYKTVE